MQLNVVGLCSYLVYHTYIIYKYTRCGSFLHLQLFLLMMDQKLRALILNLMYTPLWFVWLSPGGIGGFYPYRFFNSDHSYL